MKHIKIAKLAGIAMLSTVILMACKDSNQAPGDLPPAHLIIAETVDFDAEPSSIEAHYTEEGQNWLRMAFPDLTHRHYALKHIGKQAPDVSFKTVNNKEHVVREIDEPTIFYFTHTASEVTKEMAGYMETFQKEREDIDVYSIYPYDDVTSVESFYKDNNLDFDKDHVAVGEQAVNLSLSLDVYDVPLLVYVDETQTISYTAVGFRDLVFLNDHAESAFGEQPFYKWIDVPFEGDKEIG